MCSVETDVIHGVWLALDIQKEVTNFIKLSILQILLLWAKLFSDSMTLKEFKIRRPRKTSKSIPYYLYFQSTFHLTNNIGISTQILFFVGLLLPIFMTLFTGHVNNKFLLAKLRNFYSSFTFINEQFFPNREVAAERQNLTEKWMCYFFQSRPRFFDSFLISKLLPCISPVKVFPLN